MSRLVILYWLSQVGTYLNFRSEYLRLHTAAFVTFRLVYNIYIYPRFLSPLRHLPGPPLGGVLTGQVQTFSIVQFCIV
jgi:hypothetical protein